MTIHLAASGEGWESGDGSVYGSLREGLDAIRATLAAKSPFLRDPDTGALNGAWRWLPATEEEPEAIGGVRIDAIAIEEMAASLNDRATPIAIDGGPAPEGMLPSDVHGTAQTGGGTPANGWAHAAVVVKGADGIVELYLWAELIPSVAREVDAGRIAMGSVHFGCERIEGTDSPRGCVLISHALTNNPAVTTLAPANSVRVGMTSAWRSRAIAGRVLRGVTTTSPHAAGERSMSTENKAPESTESAPETEAARMSDALVAAVAAAMEAGLDEAALIAAIEELATKPEGEGDPEAAASSDAEAARAREVRIEHQRTIDELSKQVARMKPIVDAHEKRERDDKVIAALVKRGIDTPERRARWVSHAEKFSVDSALDGIADAHVPPATSPVPAGAKRSKTAPEAEDGERTDQARMIADAKALVPELRSKHPGEPDHVLLARAMKTVAAI